MVHKTIAHVTIKKISSLFPVEKIPLLSAREEIRKPISPRETIAKPRIEAGWRDRGFRGLLERWLLGEF